MAERISGHTGRPSIDELLGRTRVHPSPPDAGHERWCGWLKDIDTDLTDVALARMVWRTLNDAIAKNAAIPGSLLFDVQARNYGAAQAVAVRRQIDRDPRSVNLVRLLESIRVAPEVVSRPRFVGMFDWGMQHLGDRQFDEWAGAGASTDHIDVTMVDEDIRTLEAKTAAVRHYVNKHIAHLDERRARVVIPTFDDLDAAIDLLFELFRKYNVILTGSDRSVMTPVPQYDWLAPLRMPWIPDASGSNPVAIEPPQDE